MFSDVGNRLRLLYCLPAMIPKQLFMTGALHLITSTPMLVLPQADVTANCTSAIILSILIRISQQSFIGIGLSPQPQQITMSVKKIITGPE
jgi:hypothetical protein